MKWIRREERRGPRMSQGLVGLLALAGLVMLIRELPAMRRYLRMERM